MNWSRVKTVLIILFLCTDIFLLATYLSSKYSSSVISDDVINSTVEVLASNSITIDPSVIPQRTPHIPYTEAENVIYDYEAFAKSILGEALFQTDSGYESNTGRMTFHGDSFSFTVNPEAFALSDTMLVTEEKTAKEIVLTTLENLGFDLKNAEISVSKTNDGYSVILENTANSLPIFNSQVTVALSDFGITSFSGIWFNEAPSQSSTNSLKSITSVLIDIIPQVSGETEIVSLELGYNSFDKLSYHKATALIPVWKVNCKDGSTYLLDARNF